MKVYELMAICGDNTEICFLDWKSGNAIKHYDGKYLVNSMWNNYEIKAIYGGLNGIDIYIENFSVNYDDLSVEAKIKCINDYVYKICAHEHFDDLNTMRELEECVREFFINGEYHLNKFGNWYDEDFVEI